MITYPSFGRAEYEGLFYMSVRKKMFITIFKIAIAFGTETEFQFRMILICSAADTAAMPVIPLSLSYRLAVFALSVNFLRRNPAIIS